MSTTVSSSISSGPTPVRTRRGIKKLTLAIFIDALGWEIARKSGFLADLLPCRGPLDTVFGYSSTCDPTILTGVAPREHGHFAFFTYDPLRSPFHKLRWPSLLPGPLVNRGRVRRQISRLVKRQLGYTGYFQLYNVPFDLLPDLDYTERRDLYQPGGIIGGQTTLFDDLRDSRTPFHLSDWRRSEVENLQAVTQEVSEARICFAYVFLAELDAILHAHGTASDAVKDKIHWYEVEIRKLMALARDRYDEVSLSVFADHGMADVHRQCDLGRVVAEVPLKFGKDYFPVYDSTMARFWFFSRRAEQLITGALAECHDGRWLTDGELRAWGCDFPDRRYGHKFFLMHPGVLLNPSYMGRTMLAGMHGYDPSDKDSVAFFATNDQSLTLPSGLQDIRSSLAESVGLVHVKATTA